MCFHVYFVLLFTQMCLFSYLLEFSGEPQKKPPTFHYTGWLIGILLMVYYDPYIIG